MRKLYFTIAIFLLSIGALVLVDLVGSTSKTGMNEIDLGKQILIINAPSTMLSHEIFSKLEFLANYDPSVFGLNFYYDTTKLFPDSRGANVVTLESVVPNHKGDAYLYEDQNLEIEERKLINGFYPYYVINNELRKSFALKIAQSYYPDLEVENQFIICNNMFGFENFMLADFESIIEKPHLVEGKIVLVGYVGDESPDPNMLDYVDAEIYATPVGLVYDTILQANFILELLKNVGT